MSPGLLLPSSAGSCARWTLLSWLSWSNRDHRFFFAAIIYQRLGELLLCMYAAYRGHTRGCWSFVPCFHSPYRSLYSAHYKSSSGNLAHRTTERRGTCSATTGSLSLGAQRVLSWFDGTLRIVRGGNSAGWRWSQRNPDPDAASAGCSTRTTTASTLSSTTASSRPARMACASKPRR